MKLTDTRDIEILRRIRARERLSWLVVRLPDLVDAKLVEPVIIPDAGIVEGEPGVKYRLTELGAVELSEALEAQRARES